MNRDEYVTLMRMRCPQFQHFGLQPEWRPGEKDIEGFVHDEVIRQMHDPRVKEDGGVRIDGMMKAWAYAKLRTPFKPDTVDIKVIANMIERKVNNPLGPYVSQETGFRLDDVYIGRRKAAPPIKLAEFVQRLVWKAPDVVPGPAQALWHGYNSMEFEEQVRHVKTVDDWYLAYEWIHPWADGNGRTGKVLYNWLNNTLDDPVLVQDYFGGGNP